ncbi:hypothetical protein [Mesoterricola sediminis]|uniref:Uncharacterized protein n=1 Tax=Mesoterricola sediminis TaxID=2927980 RepID=A0AA48KC97_9BACT|nr:hypothetical protein [Mesoterricola sediminis]BDU76924.1 hypothetical protein METESE_18820 [Mesoterricola sediminis]
MPEWAYVALIAAALFGLHALRRAFWLFALLTLPGTLAHETCHLVLGLLLRAQPSGFTVVPRREGRGWAMGSVSFARIRWYNAFFVGVAPLLLLPAAYGLLRWRLGAHPGIGWPEALAIFAIANLVYASVPSWQDLRIAARSPIGWLLLAGGLAWGWHTLRQPRPLRPAGRVQASMGAAIMRDTRSPNASRLNGF